MPIEHRRSEQDFRYVVTTECAFCGTELDEQQALADHLPNCEAAP